MKTKRYCSPQAGSPTNQQRRSLNGWIYHQNQRLPMKTTNQQGRSLDRSIYHQNRRCSPAGSPTNQQRRSLDGSIYHQNRRLPMKTKRTCSPPPAGSPMKRMKRSSDSYLTDDCWEIIMRLSKINLNSLSLVSKQFLSITDRFRFSLTVKDAARHSLPRLLKRLTNLTSLDLSHYTYPLDELLCKISSSNFPPLKLTSLKLPRQSTFPANGLLAFSQSITTLASLTCSHVDFLDYNQLLPISRCFPLLKQLNLSHPHFDFHNNQINGIQSLLSNSPYIQHLDLSYTYFLNDQHIADLSLFLPTLASITLTNCWRLTESALFSLITNCPALTQVKMECTTIGKENSSNSFTVVSPNLKSLSLVGCQYLRDENIILFASIFPNLEVLDLSYCTDVTDKGVEHVVKNCPQLSISI